MNTLPILKSNDTVEIIAPASRCPDKALANLKALLNTWQLNCFVNENIFGEDLLCANSDKIRFEYLKNAFENETTQAIICIRGGYGSMRLIPELAKLTPPAKLKMFVGMSDITALNLYLNQAWNWPILHGAPIIETFSEESIASLKSILFGEINHIEWKGLPLNEAAHKPQALISTVTGGNLCLVHTSIGTLWQINSYNKILFLEDINERGFRVDRMLEHLRQSNLLKGVKAIVFGDFIKGEETDGSSLIDAVLLRFAQSCEFPVIKIEGAGHGPVNFPLPLGTKAQLILGDNITLNCSR